MKKEEEREAKERSKSSQRLNATLIQTPHNGWCDLTFLPGLNSPLANIITFGCYQWHSYV